MSMLKTNPLQRRINVAMLQAPLASPSTHPLRNLYQSLTSRIFCPGGMVAHRNSSDAFSRVKLNASLSSAPSRAYSSSSRNICIKKRDSLAFGIRFKWLKNTNICLHIFPSPVLESEFSPLFRNPLGEIIAALVAAVWRSDKECHNVVQVRVVELHGLWKREKGISASPGACRSLCSR